MREEDVMDVTDVKDVNEEDLDNWWESGVLLYPKRAWEDPRW